MTMSTTSPERAAGPTAYYRFRPLNIGRYLIWSLFAIALIVLPMLFTSSLAVTMLSQMGYAIIICLSYNILLGQGGMLSFGHAVYTGLGSFIAIHAMNLAAAGKLPIPLVLIPLVGGLAGMFFAILLGFVTTKKSGTTFAMITLGIGELVASMALMFPEFFGGEGGVTTNRVYGQSIFGMTFGPAIQVYYLIAAYCFVCTAAMFAFTATPLGRILNAVRDNPERVEFIGYNTQRVRYFAFIIAGFFAGIGGGLAAINFEIVTGADSVNMVRSGGYLLFTFLGGATFFFGPIIGGVLLLWIGMQLLGNEEEGDAHSKETGGLMAAVRTILIADVVMSLDNVIAVAAAAKGSTLLLMLGLAISIPLVVFGSTLMIKLMERFPIIVTLGAALIGWVGGETIVSDVALKGVAAANPWLHYAAAAGGAALVIGLGKFLNSRRTQAAAEH